jgi:membrane protein implicated in regulation of membrane protease activity
MEWLRHIDFWHWWILAGVLLLLELSAPTYFFLWLGIAAAAVGFLVLVFPAMTVEVQFVAFGVLSIFAVLAWRRYRETHVPESDQIDLNKRGLQYAGRVFTLDHPIINGVGKVEIDDSTWSVKGPDLPAGSDVRVTGVDGAVIEVEAVEAG